MTEFEVYVYRILLLAFAGIVWYYFKRDGSGIRKDIRELIDEVKELTTHLARHEEKFDAMGRRLDNVDNRLNSHHNDIKEIQRKQDKCNNFDPRP